MVAISARGAAITGAWMMAVPGIFAGAIAGAFIAWLAGAVIGWQQHLAFTLGVAANLLPFGDQLGVLQVVSDNWMLVIPAAALAGGLVAAVWGAFIGGVLAALYDRYPVARVIWVTLDPASGTVRDRGRRRRPRRPSGEPPD